MQLIPGLLHQRFAATRALLIGNQRPLWEWPKQWPELTINFVRSVPKSSKTKLAASRLTARRPTSVIKKIISLASALIVVTALGVAAITFGPQLYHQVVPVETVPVISQEESSPIGGNFDLGTAATSSANLAATKYMPPRNESLPDGEWVIIPRIGVRTQLLKTASSAPALEKGVWWVPDFGTPGDQTKPMILVAHRFGYKWWWQSDYWKYHSFYLLPELQPGDTVEIIADKRKWTYEVYAGEEGEQITDYQADLILYTCKYLKDTVRYFRYARLVNPEVDTQHLSAKTS